MSEPVTPKPSEKKPVKQQDLMETVQVSISEVFWAFNGAF